MDSITVPPNEDYIAPKVIQDKETTAEYLLMELYNNSHFYGIPVNTNYSAVHVPTNVFDQGIIFSHICNQEFNS